MTTCQWTTGIIASRKHRVRRVLGDAGSQCLFPFCWLFLYFPSSFLHPFRRSSISICADFIDFFPYSHTQITTNYHMQGKRILSAKKSMSGGSCERGASSSKPDTPLPQQTPLGKITLPPFPGCPGWVPNIPVTLSIPEITTDKALTWQAEMQQQQNSDISQI